MKRFVVILMAFALILCAMPLFAETPVTVNGTFSFGGITDFTKEGTGHAYPDWNVNLQANVDEHSLLYFRYRGKEGGYEPWYAKKIYIQTNLATALDLGIPSLTSKFGFTDMDTRGSYATGIDFETAVYNAAAIEGAGIWLTGSLSENYAFQMAKVFDTESPQYMISFQPYMFELVWGGLGREGEKGIATVDAGFDVGWMHVGLALTKDFHVEKTSGAIGIKHTITDSFNVGTGAVYDSNEEGKLGIDANYVVDPWGAYAGLGLGLGNIDTFGGLDLAGSRKIGEKFTLYAGYYLTETDSWWAGYKAPTAGPEHNGGFYLKGSLSL